jgi:enterochelin esterase family protein
MKWLMIVCFWSLFFYVTPQQIIADADSDFTSTEVLPGNKVIFRIRAPQAKQVMLHSDDKWEPISFIKDSLGVWKGVWHDVKPGAYRYNFVVDGVTVCDPAAPLTNENISVLFVTSGLDFFSMKQEVPHGSIAQRYYFSKSLKKTRRLHVWTPPGFEKLKRKLPVLYLIHGGGDTDKAWSTIGCW